MRKKSGGQRRNLSSDVELFKGDLKRINRMLANAKL